jgi:DNA-binding transcriptional LysR family regulator
LITHDKGSFAGLKSISWRQAATLPLCLLTPAMQNRRIIDSIFESAGTQNRAVLETNSLVTLWSHIRFGQWSTVVPHTFLLLLQRQSDVIVLPLIEPDASHVLGMVVSDREPVSPLVRELLSVAGQFDLPSQIKRHIVQSWPVTVWERRS